LTAVASGDAGFELELARVKSICALWAVTKRKKTSVVVSSRPLILDLHLSRFTAVSPTVEDP
jgi:hypothetical protein